MSVLPGLRALKRDAAKPRLILTDEQWEDPVVRAAYAIAFHHAIEECIEIVEQAEEEEE